jgi:hypothetical protein
MLDKKKSGSELGVKDLEVILPLKRAEQEETSGRV